MDGDDDDVGVVLTMVMMTINMDKRIIMRMIQMMVVLTMVMMTMVALHNGQHRISAPNGTITQTLVLTTAAQHSTADKCSALDHPPLHYFVHCDQFQTHSLPAGSGPIQSEKRFQN